MQTDRVGGGVKNKNKNLGSYTPRPPGHRHRHLHAQPPSQFVTGSTSRSTSVLRRCCVKVLKLSCLGFPWQRWCFAELICSLNADERGEHKLHYIWSRTARELRHGPSLTVDEVVQSGALTEIEGRAGRTGKVAAWKTCLLHSGAWFGSRSSCRPSIKRRNKSCIR